MSARTNRDLRFGSTVVGFDYGSLATSIRKQIQDETQAIRHLVVNTASNIIQIGLRLQFVRNCLGRHCFQAWLKAEFEWSQSVASNYMRAAAVFSDIDCLDRFQPSALYSLARHRACAAARTEALERARAGEIITKASADVIIHKHGGLPAHRTVSVVAEICGTLKRLEASLDGLSTEEVQQISAQLATSLARLKSVDSNSHSA